MSIFDLKQDTNELSSVNAGISQMKYVQQAPTRDCTGKNFSNGQISFKFSTSGQQWWLPSRTYLRLRLLFAKGDSSVNKTTADTALSMNLVSNLFQSCEFRIQDKTVSRVGDFVAQVDTLQQRMNKSKSYLDSVGASTNYWQPKKDDRLGTDRTKREVIWAPPLSVFGITEALPAGDYELILTPYNDSAIGQRVVEAAAAIDRGSAADEFQFSVEDMYLYVAEVSGPRSDNMSYYLDLDNIRCQSDTINNKDFQAKTFDVSPSTHALSVAYQDGRVGTDVRLPSTKFKVSPTAVSNSGAEELKLSRMYIQYAGQSVPNPDAAPDYDDNTDRTVQRYLDTQLYSGALFDTGGCETLEEFQARGPYYHFVIPRDGSDRSTRVQVHQGFQNSTYVDNMRVLLFDHYKSVARVEIRDGRVVNVDIEEA